jgi:sugar lactone lactonase YvrE
MRTLKTWLCACLTAALFAACFPIAAAAQQGIATPPANSPLITHVELFNTTSNGGTAIPYGGGQGGGLAYDAATGDIYFAENPYSGAGAPQIIVIHSNGTASVLPSPSTGFGDLTALVWYQGNLYAADGIGYSNPYVTQLTANNVIWQYVPSTSVWTQIVTNVNNPTGIAFGPGGNLFVASWADETVYEYPYNSANGSFGSPQIFWTTTDPTAAPYAIAFDQIQEYLYVCGFGAVNNNGTKVFRVSSNGVSSVYFDSQAADPGGAFFSDSQGGNQYQEPTSLAFDSNDYLYIGYYNALKIVRIAPNGTSIAVFPGGGSADDAPNGLAVTPQGDVITVVNGYSTTDTLAAVIKIHGTGPSMNAAADFSPTVNGGPWSYGYTFSTGGTITPLSPSPNMTATDFIANSTSPYGLDFWLTNPPWDSPRLDPDIVHNGGASTLSPFCCAVIPPNGLGLQPGPLRSGIAADVRWTALFSGQYLVFGIWSGLDFSSTNTTGLTIINSSVISNPYSINSFGPLSSFPITPFTTLAPKGTIDFNVTSNSNNDMTGLDAVVVQAGDATPLSVNANSVWCVTQPVGTSTGSATFSTITNVSADAQLIGPIQLVGANASDFQISGDSCSNTTVNPGGSCSFTTSFLPSALGARTAFVLATSTDNTAIPAHVVSEQFPVVGIGVANTTVSLNSSSNPIPWGTSGNVTYTATVTSAVAGNVVGSVQFYDGQTLLASVPLSGSSASSTQTIPSLGLHAISAVFIPGSSTFVGISSASIQEAVATPVSIYSASAATFYVGQAGSFQILAAGIPPAAISITSGTLPSGLTFTDSGAGYATISGTPASGTSGTYNLTITAANAFNSVTQALTLTVTAFQSISFAPIPGHFVGDAPFAVSASASSGLPVTLTASGNCTISGNIVTVTGAGACVIAATQSGDSTYGAAAPVSQSFNIVVHPAPCPANVTSTVFVNTTYQSGTIPFFGGEAAGVATDPNGNVYIAENPFPFQTAAGGYYSGASPAILMVSADGSTQTLLTPPGGFGEVTAVAFYQGNLYVADGLGYSNQVYPQATAYNAIWQYNPGTGGWSEPIGVNNPTGIAFSNGNIYVSSWQDQRVYAFSPSGATLGTVWIAPDGTAAPYGLAFDASGDLFIAGFGGNPSNTGTKIFEVAAADVAGYTQNYSVFLDPGINEPASLAFDAFGNLFASYYDSVEILRITPNGTYSTVPVGLAGAPNGLAFDTNNNLFAVVNVGTIGGQVIKIQGVICSPATPMINWPIPSAILYGTALSATQLDATAVDASNNPIAGTFTYTPAASTVPNPGTQRLSVTFAPTDTANYLSATASVPLTVNQAPAFTSAATTTFVASTAGSFTATASGYPAVAFTESGALPNGVTLSSSGLLSGTPTTGSGGVYNFTITATNGISPDATQAFALTVNEAPRITSAASATFTAGAPGSFSLTATGYPAPTFSETVTLPGGVTLSSSGVLSGTPAATAGGAYTITITATNAISSSNQNFTLTVDQAPAITSAAAATFAVGSAGSFPMTATGYPAATFSEVGALPSGVTFSSSGVLSGTSAVGTGGTYAITVTAANGTLPNATQAFTLTVTDTPTGASVVVTPIDTSKKTTPVTLTFAAVSQAGYTSLTTSSSGPALPTGFTAGSPVIYYNLSTTAVYSGLITMSIDFTGTTFTTTPHLLHYDPVAGAWTDITTLLSGSIIRGSVSSLSPFTVAEETPTLPSVTTNPANQTAAAGSNVTFTSAATGNRAPTVQWQVSASGGLFTNISGATSTTLTLTAVTASMNGNEYQAVFTNNVGSATTTAATLTVNFAPSVTTSPASQAVTAGSNATFTTAATGNPAPTVQWQVSASGGPFTNISGATSTTLTLTGVTTSQNGYLYQAVFTNSVGSATTSAATLTVNSAPTVTANPLSQTVTAGSNVTFSAAATGNPAPTVQWQVSTNGGTSYASVPGATSTTLTLTGVTTSQNGYMYLAVFTNSVGSATSTAATLTVNSANSAPVVTTNPVSQTVPLGSSVTFTAAATGNPTPTVQWQVSTNGGAVFTNISGATSTTFMLTAVTASMNGNQYRAVFTNTAGSATTLPATLTVSGTSQAPAITSASSTTFPIGVSSSFTVTTTGTPTPKITISMTTESPTLPAGVTFVDNGNGTATLSGTPAAKTQNYSFTITASNGVKPNTTQKFTLTVGEAPMFTSSASTGFAINTASTFTIRTSGFPATVITESGALPTGIAFVAYTNGTATLSGTSSASGTYPITLTATNTLGSAQQAFTLTLGVAPAITSANKTQFTVAVPGTFTVTTTGIPNPHLSIPATAKLPSGVTFVDNGNGTATLSGTPAAGTAGKYTFTITATDGVSPKATQSFTLTVNQPPAITSANSASFTVGVSGPTFTITTTGFPTANVTKTGILPKGLSFTPHSNGTATISGTPVAGTAGTYSLTVTASNGVLPNATQVLTLTVH